MPLVHYGREKISQWGEEWRLIVGILPIQRLQHVRLRALRHLTSLVALHCAGSFLGDNFADKPLLQRLNWIHVPMLTLTPLIALYGILTVRHDPRTWAFAFVYYFFTGLGITAGACKGGAACTNRLSSISVPFFTFSFPPLLVSRLPPPLCAPLLLSNVASARAVDRAWLWCCGGLGALVVSRPPRAPPLRGHGQGPVLGDQGLLVRAHWLDARQARQDAYRQG